MWIYINNLFQVIWLAENWKWVWHLNLFSMTRVNFTFGESATKIIVAGVDPIGFLSGFDLIILLYLIYIFRQTGQVCANSVDPDLMPQNTTSNQGLHCLPLTQQFYTHSQVVKWTYWREVQGKAYQIYQIYPKFPMKIKFGVSIAGNRLNLKWHALEMLYPSLHSS